MTTSAGTSANIHITVTSEVPSTARLAQVAGMFDYRPTSGRQTRTWNHTLPLDEKPWQIGLIVGPSGSGKTQLATHLWPEQVAHQHQWPADQSIIDALPASLTIHQITEVLTAVGLGSVPAWVRPHHTLSNGEQFRADVARTILENPSLAVVDEFTSVVDRQVAKVASHAIQRTIRRHPGARFVAVTCHFDVEEWLQPDWVYDVAASTFTWRSVQPHPPLTLTIHRAPRSLWAMFEHHHYLSGRLHNTARCFAAYVDGYPVAFTSYIHFPHPRVNDIKMGHRLVVLPDWQGIGIATHLENWLGEYLTARGLRYRNAVAHPGMIRLYSRSPRWQQAGRSTHIRTAMGNLSTRRLAVTSFEYRPQPKDC